LRDDSGHLKVADFGVSKLLKVAKTVKEDKPVTSLDTSCRFSYTMESLVMSIANNVMHKSNIVNLCFMRAVMCNMLHIL